MTLRRMNSTQRDESYRRQAKEAVCIQYPHFFNDDGSISDAFTSFEEFDKGFSLYLDEYMKLRLQETHLQSMFRSLHINWPVILGIVCVINIILFFTVWLD